MKILFVTQDDPFHLPSAFERILGNVDDEVVGVLVLSSFVNGKIKTFKRLMSMYGLFNFAKEGLYFVYYKMLGRTVSNVFKKLNFPAYKMSNINSEESLKLIKNMNPDLIVSYGSPQIFKKDLLNIPKKGVINIHSSLLPSYKGLYPGFWVLTNNEKETGVSVHFMDENVDTGQIICQKRFLIDENETFYSVYRKNVKLGVELLLKALDDIGNDRVETIRSEGIDSSYYSWPKRKDRIKFFSNGGKFR